MILRSLVFDAGTSDKFWTIELEGSTHTVHFGRAGTAGQVKRKEFDSPEKARAAADKLIAEKVRKGYRDDPAGPAASMPAAAAPAPNAPAPTPVIAAGSPARASDDVPPIELSPIERSLPSWLPIADPPAGDPQPFDPERLRHAHRLGTLDYGFWRWPHSPISGPVTAEEAMYWLRLIPEHRPGVSANQRHAEALAAPSTMPAAEAIERAAECWLPGGDQLALLVTVIGPDAALEAIMRPIDPRTHHGGGLIGGVRRHLLPWLDSTQRDRLAAHAADRLQAQRALYPTSINLELTLVAQLGLHELVEEAVASWPDGWMAQLPLETGNYPTIALGVSSAPAYEDLVRRLGMLMGDETAVAGLLAALGLRGLDMLEAAGLAAESRETAEQVIAPLASRVHAPELAPVMIRLRRGSRAPGLAAAWLTTHPTQTAAGLAPLLTRSGAAADDARDELLRMARAERRSALEALLPTLEPAQATALRERVLDAAPPPPPPLQTTPAFLTEAAARLRRAPLPGWLVLEELAPLIVDGGAVAGADFQTVIAIFRTSTPEAPDPAVAALKRALDPALASAFAWELLDAWLAGGAPAKDKWALTAVGLLGDDSTALRLAPLVRRWPGESQHKRAVHGLDVLRMIGSDVALMQLNGIAQRLKFKALQQRAREAMAAIAAELGLSQAELEDRIVPDCGLAADGTRTFDYGPRRFTFALGPGMKPMLRDDAGKLRPAPPKPRADDDPELAAAAIAEWKLMRKTVAEVVKLQIPRLEQAMVSGRRWRAEDFTTLVAGHPLQRHLVRRLVLGDYAAGGRPVSFRLTDEGDLAGHTDEAFALGDGARVGIVHPLELGPDEHAAWDAIFTDYELIPPFPQLWRPTFDLAPAELASDAVTTFAGRDIPPVTLIGTLERLGWTRGEPQDGGAYYLHAKPFPGAGCTAVIEYEAGAWIGYPSEGPDLQVNHVYALDGEIDAKALGYGDHRGMRWSEVPPVVRSEVLADVHAVLERAQS